MMRPLAITLLLFAGTARAGPLAVIAFGEAAEQIEPEVRSALSSVDGVTLQPRAATLDEMKAAAGSGLVCGPESDECVVKFAVVAGLERVITVTAAPAPDGLHVQLAHIDAGLARRTGAVELVLPGGNTTQALEDAALMLLAPEKHFGALVVVVHPSGARVFVNGVERAVAAPRASLLVRAGSQRVEARLPGHEPAGADVDIAVGAQMTVEFALRPLDATAPVGARGGPAPAPAEAAPAIGVPLMVLGGGAIVATAGLGTAITIDGLLVATDIGDADARDLMLLVERVAAGVAVAGGVAVATGVILFASE